MMNGRRKSDRPVVATKPANKVGAATNDVDASMAEQVERRGLAKGKPPGQNTDRALDRTTVQSALGRIRQAAVKDKKVKFTSLMHHIYDLSMLREAYYGLKRDAAPGVDGETWRQYGEKLESNLAELSARLRRGAYRAQAVLRRFITKDDGRLRPLGVTALEDKLVQRATVMVLNAIYETDFLGFSYGYRPGKGQHNALDALYTGLLTRKVNWVLDGDISSFFDGLDHEWLVKFVEHRIADQRVVRLIRKWLNAGVLENGQWSCSEEGTPQGGSASPLLANIYLHYVFDLWVQHWRKTKAKGDMIVVRWADDFVVGFQHRSEAERFHKELAERFANFKLKLHPEKTRLIEFGCWAVNNRKGRGQGKPETFNFLGFTHICGKKRSNGMFTVYRRTMSKRKRAKLKEIKTELRKRIHQRVTEVGKWLRSVVEGHNRYYGVPSNLPSLYSFRFHVVRHWYRTLRRRSQKTRLTWERMYRLVNRWLPPPLLHHPYPLRRLGVIT
ncbi:MAG: group II intron reverse transcriptase/maturase [Acidobacteria bacterium]|nr:group II intron reverse transcriptase/maturase [Acidobacteriota bacterium]